MMSIPSGVRKWGGWYYIDLNSDEIADIDRPVNGSGGFETFLRKLQDELNHATGAVKLSAEDLDYIPHAAFDYTDGGFEGRLLKIFGRVLGPRLGRDDEPS
ncbi:MAG: aspartyl-tRNA synthetase [bacterium]